MWETVKNVEDSLRLKNLRVVKWQFGREVPNRNVSNDYPMATLIATGVGLQAIGSG